MNAVYKPTSVSVLQLSLQMQLLGPYNLKLNQGQRIHKLDATKCAAFKTWQNKENASSQQKIGTCSCELVLFIFPFPVFSFCAFVNTACLHKISNHSIHQCQHDNNMVITRQPESYCQLNVANYSQGERNISNLCFNISTAVALKVIRYPASDMRIQLKANQPLQTTTPAYVAFSFLPDSSFQLTTTVITYP